jgi:hypothetical protein
MNSEQFSENKSEVRRQDSPYWSEKGVPREQFDVLFEGKKVEVANFSETALSKEQLNSLRLIIGEFSRIKNGEVFDKVKSIFIDNIQLEDPETKVGVNGMSVEKDDGIIKLYPRALENIPHRVKGVSNFDGTLIHELTHALVDPETRKRWKNKFGWKKNEEKEAKLLDKLGELGISVEELYEMPQKDWAKLGLWEFIRIEEVDKPQRCVTDYAKLGPNDDIAESMVAAMTTGDLDSERLKFLKHYYLSNTGEELLPKVEIQKR